LSGHVGIIMDGNGRWARSRGLPRTAGHLEGLQAAKRVVAAASDLGVDYLTLYTFSTENWKRAASEVGYIMGLVKTYLRGELEFYRERGIRIRHAGDRAGLPADIREELDLAMRDTAAFTGMQVILALNYGGRDEIVRAVNRAIQAGAGPVTPETLSACLDNPDVPDPDLIIRTGGEFRTSNFLLWEGAYAEYYVDDTYWPDWGERNLREALQNFAGRNRRFGGVEA